MKTKKKYEYWTGELNKVKRIRFNLRYHYLSDELNNTLTINGLTQRIELKEIKLHDSIYKVKTK